MKKASKRLIPVLTIDGEKLVKTIRFKKPNYIGDPINAVKIFNDKMVDEVVLLDISATKESREPNYSKIEEICSEAFMPFAYGGGIKNIEQIKILFSLGIEKVILNSVLSPNLELIKEAASIYGSQSIIASVDVNYSILGKKYKAYTESGRKKVKLNLMEYLTDIESAGAGELFLNSIDRDGTFKGFDLRIINSASKHLGIPLVACGGAGKITDFEEALKAGASAVAAGSYFVYRSENRGVLISYPTQQEIERYKV